MSFERVSVIIPAHNEEAVIQRTLRTLLRGAKCSEFEVFVVCNGCSDRTADVAAKESKDIIVIETDEASKTAAINAGLRAASSDVVILLDADIDLDTAAARRLAQAASRPGVEVAIGHMDVDTQGADFLVRAFYRVWVEHPYLSNGKFAAAIALSRAGLARIGELPRIVADDTYLRRLFPPAKVAVAESVHFMVRAPRNVVTLVKVRARSHFGTRQLASTSAPSERYPGETRELLQRLIVKPMLWPLVPVYLFITLAARGLSYRVKPARWERDLTTRISGAT